MDMRCIHFSNKKKKVLGDWCEGGMCSLSSPTLRPVKQARSSSTPSNLQQPIMCQSHRTPFPAYYLLVLKLSLQECVTGMKRGDAG